MCRAVWVAMGLVASVGSVGVRTSPPPTFDLVVYGGTSAGLSAAVQAKRMGLTNVVVLEPTTRIGGLTTGGLGQTDIGVKWAFGGIAREFYRDIRAHYNDARSWKWQKKGDYRSKGQSQTADSEDTMWTFEPSAALTVLEGWEKRDGLDIRRGEWLDRGKGGVTVEDGRITAIRTLSGKVFRGRMFVDATYEGDLMAAAGVTYAVGREANAVYGETINGVQSEWHPASFPKEWDNQIHVPVDPYVVPGDKSSGLLRGVEPEVREARRMVGDYVMTEHDCRQTRKVPRPVALAAYGMDSHNVRRHVVDGKVRNEGDVQDHKFKRPYPVEYGSIVPRKAECANLFVPVCVSASHIAFGSIRMEPVFFALGQVAGTAAAQALSDGCAVQDVDYAKLRARLLSDGQVVSPEASPARTTE